MCTIPSKQQRLRIYSFFARIAAVAAPEIQCYQVIGRSNTWPTRSIQRKSILFIYLLISHFWVPLHNDQWLNIVLNCSVKIKIEISCRIPNTKVFSFFLKSLVLVIGLMSTGRPFHALEAATENARFDESSLKRRTSRSCLPAERREARPEMLVTEVTNSVKYDGARPLTAWCAKRSRVWTWFSLQLVTNQWSSYIAGVT